MLEILNKILDLLLSVIPSSKTTLKQTKNGPKNDVNKDIDSESQTEEKNGVAITLEAYFNDPQSGEDRRQKYREEYTTEIRDNATKLLEKVNALLLDLGIMSCLVSSGWRPSAVNKAAGGAKRSLHMRGMAIDLRDGDGGLDRKIEEKPELLQKHGLWLESPDHTPGWCHLDMGTRWERPVRIFKP
jgi:hypothetical protein